MRILMHFALVLSCISFFPVVSVGEGERNVPREIPVLSFVCSNDTYTSEITMHNSANLALSLYRKGIFCLQDDTYGVRLGMGFPHQEQLEFESVIRVLQNNGRISKKEASTIRDRFRVNFLREYDAFQIVSEKSSYAEIMLALIDAEKMRRYDRMRKLAEWTGIEKEFVLKKADTLERLYPGDIFVNGRRKRLFFKFPSLASFEKDWNNRVVLSWAENRKGNVLTVEFLDTHESYKLTGVKEAYGLWSNNAERLAVAYTALPQESEREEYRKLIASPLRKDSEIEHFLHSHEYSRLCIFSETTGKVDVPLYSRNENVYRIALGNWFDGKKLTVNVSRLENGEKKQSELEILFLEKGEIQITQLRE